jgi:hypothetical protein
MKRYSTVKWVVYGIIGAASVNALYAIFVIVISGVRLLFISELRAQLLGAGLFALAAVTVYYLLKLWHWTYLLGKRW